MTQRTDYLIQILDKIGGPLMGAVTAVPAQGDGENESSDAQAIASLLGKVVEVSIAMNESMDLTAADAQDDALRAALAALAGPLVAGQYKQNARVPNEGDLKRMQASVQAILTFADNFTPDENLGADHAQRLEQIEANGQAIDTHQINIQYVHAFIPVINAVSAFPFGQPEQKLVMDVSDRLVKRAVEIRETLVPGLGGDEQKLAELSILRSLSGLYAACHGAETKRLSGMSDAAPGESSMEPVWKNFDIRSAMLEAVVKNILPGDALAAPLPAAPAPVADASPPPAEPPPEPETTKPVQEAAAPDSGGNPMSFFGAPKQDSADDNSSDESITPPSPPPAAPPESETPPTPPAEPPPAAPPAESPDDNGGDNTSGSPMSFFTKKDEED